LPPLPTKASAKAAVATAAVIAATMTDTTATATATALVKKYENLEASAIKRFVPFPKRTGVTWNLA
jgi:hypothetical protein